MEGFQIIEETTAAQETSACSTATGVNETVDEAGDSG